MRLDTIHSERAGQFAVESNKRSLRILVFRIDVQESGQKLEL